MSKYDPLAHHLAEQSGREHPMTFREIEHVIGGRLPSSAREHRPWWANNEQGHVQKRGWLNAGYKTARVDMAAERVVFVKEEGPPAVGSISFAAAAPLDDPAEVTIAIASLPLAVRHLIDLEIEDTGGNRESAIASLLMKAVVAHRTEMLEHFVGKSRPGSDSVDLVREDRDER